MKDMFRTVLSFLFLLTVTGCAGTNAFSGELPRGPHTATVWELKPSLKFDALCLLNTLSGDPYYLTYYRAEYEYFNPLFTSEEKAAFRELKRIIKDEASGIVSANLALYFSAVDDETLDQMIRTAHDSSEMRAALGRTTYWDANGWTTYERARPFLEAALRALQRIGFERYWEANARPRVERRIAELSPALAKYNLITAIESKLGKPLATDHITVYLLAYSQPHGIRITGTRFLTHVSYPFSIVLHNAIHEMMHPPYDQTSPAIAHAIEELAVDHVIRDQAEHHDKSFGYNSPAGYVEEDSVQALEEIISEQFGIGRNPREYWEKQDGGMHILAVAIYVQYGQSLKEKDGAIPFPQWLVEAVRKGNLQGEQLIRINRAFFAGKSSSAVE